MKTYRVGGSVRDELLGLPVKDRDWVVVGDLAQILGSGENVASFCLRPDGLHLRESCLERVAQWLRVNEPVG